MVDDFDGDSSLLRFVEGAGVFHSFYPSALRPQEPTCVQEAVVHMEMRGKADAGPLRERIAPPQAASTLPRNGVATHVPPEPSHHLQRPPAMAMNAWLILRSTATRCQKSSAIAAASRQGSTTMETAARGRSGGGNGKAIGSRIHRRLPKWGQKMDPSHPHPQLVKAS